MICLDTLRAKLNRLNEKQRDQIAKFFHAISMGSGLAVIIDLMTDGEPTPWWAYAISFACGIICQYIAIVVLRDRREE